MFKVLAAGAFLLLSTGSLKGQSGSQMSYNNLISVTPMSENKGKLTVGDVMPNITFNNLINYKAPSARLSDFKGKLVILDFWATTCSGCIGGFPKMDAMQSKFKNELQVILVNTKRMKDTPEKVARTFKKFKENTGYDVTLPYMIADTVLENYLSYRYIPHHVWINGEGKIVAVTSGDEVTEENIRSFLKGESNVKIRYKKDDLTFDKSKPLFVDNNGSPGNAIIRRSTITKYIEGLAFFSGIFKFSKSAPSRYCSINTALVSIYHDAFNIYALPMNRWIFETSRSDIFLKNDSPERTNYYCYELIAQVDSLAELKALMREDLVKNFKVEVKKEKRLRDVYILQKKKDVDAQAELEKGIKQVGYVRKSFDNLLYVLNNRLDNPVLDDTKRQPSTDKILVPTDYDSYDKKEIVAMLSDMGFVLKQEKRRVDVLIFKDAEIPFKY